MKRKAHYFLLILILGLAFWVRIYRMDDLLRFYYDQGRDALIVWEMIHNFKPVLVGPTTGLAGILRGPTFYYILYPAYLIGRGNPVIASICLQVINLFGLYIFYLLAKKMFSPLAGLVAVILLGFSAHMVDLSRWLSEPSMTLTAIPVFLYAVVKAINERKQKWWVVAAFTLGISLHFELASEIWMVPVFFILWLIYSRKNTPSALRASPPNLGGELFVPLAFLFTFIPQILFEIRHDGIMRKAIVSNFTNQTGGSFGLDKNMLFDRLGYYYQTLNYLITPNFKIGLAVLILLLLPLLLFKEKREKFYLPFVFLLVPLSVLAFFKGNSGNFYSYYLIGVFPIFLLIVSGMIGEYLRNKKLLWVGLICLLAFGLTNSQVLKNFLTSGIDGPNSITIKNQTQTLDWIYQNNIQGQSPYVEVYVPPVIPYSYDYLFKWYGQKTYGYQPSQTETETVFLLYETDPNHPERLEEWYKNKTVNLIKKDEYTNGGLKSESFTRK